KILQLPVPLPERAVDPNQVHRTLLYPLFERFTEPFEAQPLLIERFDKLLAYPFGLLPVGNVLEKEGVLFFAVEVETAPCDQEWYGAAVAAPAVGFTSTRHARPEMAGLTRGRRRASVSGHLRLDHLVHVSANGIVSRVSEDVLRGRVERLHRARRISHDYPFRRSLEDRPLPPLFVLQLHHLLLNFLGHCHVGASEDPDLVRPIERQILIQVFAAEPGDRPRDPAHGIEQVAGEGEHKRNPCEAEQKSDEDAAVSNLCHRRQDLLVRRGDADHQRVPDGAQTELYPLEISADGYSRRRLCLFDPRRKSVS